MSVLLARWEELGATEAGSNGKMQYKRFMGYASFL